MKNLNSLRRSSGIAALFAFGVVLASGASAQQAQQPKPQGTPAPKILVIDRNAILGASKVGQDIVRQVKALTAQAEKEFKGQNDALRNEGAALQQQIAILSPDVKRKKIADFEAKQAAFQKRVEERQNQIQGGVLVARQQVEKALGPILQGIMNERQANLLLDRNAIVLGTIDIDVSRVAVQRLDQKMQTVKVTLYNPPPQQQAKK